MPKKTERGDHLGNFFRKKRLTVPRNAESGDSLVTPGMVCYAEKGKTFGSVR